MLILGLLQSFKRQKKSSGLIGELIYDLPSVVPLWKIIERCRMHL
ncbi:hypothetical protein Q671_02590 [Halomonas sp. PBN3]|nr:hypothetical protein Q671_02590 [Halomonas sp. PBN3]